jgi:hypothetical protein
MHQKTKNIQKRYAGFLQTPALWMGNAIFEIHQFELPSLLVKVAITIDEKMRLGRYVERFVSFQLAQFPEYTIISENLQIQKNKITLGELDCLLTMNSQAIHLEISYKFYLYDATVGDNEIAHFIGPNRKDSLLEKLTKLQQKQLPMLYSEACATYLKNLALEAKEMRQYVCFKAQLFVPFSNRNLQLKEINQACIVGFYANSKEIQQFSTSKFFIPIKKDWLMPPFESVHWLTFDQFICATKEFLSREFSPLCWLKKPNGEIEKFFFVWWI